MTIWNLGSINADMVYTVPHLPDPGETLAAGRLDRFLGGKGANMSVAAARAGAQVHHIGAVGPDGRWAIDRLGEYGVNTAQIAVTDVPTGHAIICVDSGGENQIVLYPGANREISTNQLCLALAEARAGDLLIFQNETNAQREAAQLAREQGLRVCYAAAPFSADAVKNVLPFLDFLILNEIEASQLEQATGLAPDRLSVPDVIVTLGSRGARHYNSGEGKCREFQAFKVDAIDTTGAGDTFTGYVLAGLDRGISLPSAVDLAMRAAALMVMRHGTADVIPDLAEVSEADLS